MMLLGMMTTRQRCLKSVGLARADGARFANIGRLGGGSIAVSVGLE